MMQSLCWNNEEIVMYRVKAFVRSEVQYLQYEETVLIETEDYERAFEEFEGAWLDENMPRVLLESYDGTTTEALCAPCFRKEGLCFFALN